MQLRWQCQSVCPCHDRATTGAVGSKCNCDGKVSKSCAIIAGWGLTAKTTPTQLRTTRCRGALTQSPIVSYHKTGRGHAWLLFLPCSNRCGCPAGRGRDRRDLPLAAAPSASAWVTGIKKREQPKQQKHTNEKHHTTEQKNKEDAGKKEEKKRQNGNATSTRVKHLQSRYGTNTKDHSFDVSTPPAPANKTKFSLDPFSVHGAPSPLLRRGNLGFRLHRQQHEHQLSSQGVRVEGFRGAEADTGARG